MTERSNEGEADEWLADQIRIHLGHGLHRSGFDFIIDDSSTSLAQAAENSFYDHVVAFPHIRFSEADHFYRAGRVLQQETKCRLPITIGRELKIRHAPADGDHLMIVMVWMGEQFGDFDESGREEGDGCHSHEHAGQCSS